MHYNNFRDAGIKIACGRGTGNTSRGLIVLLDLGSVCDVSHGTGLWSV